MPGPSREPEAAGDTGSGPAVRALYERWPFPHRDPADERRRLIWTPLDFLTAIGERCFAGGCAVPRGARVLIAGCGTGDSAIWLAEQLRERDAEVVALDVSATSLDVTRARADARGLSLELVHASLLDLPRLDVGTFDYVNCGGVLHHLDDPDRGLAALTHVLAPEGVLGLMVYGRFGRAGVDVVRGLADALGLADDDPVLAVETTARLLAALPSSNLFRCMTSLGAAATDANAWAEDPGAIADMFLHPRERSYTVTEIHDWLSRSGLQWRDWAASRHAYRPRAWLADPALLARIDALPVAARHAVAERLGCTLRTHAFYASHRGASHRGVRWDAADDTQLVPLWWSPRPRAQILEALRRDGRARFGSAEATFVLDAAEFVEPLVEGIDGQRTLAAILDRFEPGARVDARRRFVEMHELIGLGDELFVRDLHAPAPAPPQILQRRAFGAPGGRAPQEPGPEHP